MPMSLCKEVQRVMSACSSIPCPIPLFANPAAASSCAPLKFPPCFNFPGLKYLFTALPLFLTPLKPALHPSNSVKMWWLKATSQPANDHGPLDHD